MARRKLFVSRVASIATVIIFAQAWPRSGLVAAQRSGGGHHHGGHGGFVNGGGQVGFVNINGRRVPGPFFAGFGVGVPFFYAPIFVLGPGMMVVPAPVPSGPLMAPPVPGMLEPPVDLNARPARVRVADPNRAAQLLIVGDRLLRAGNLKKAEERYLQALQKAPDLAAPRVRLAQVAMARANYAEAASRLREAETAEPGWILTAPDIQSIFGEPTEFTRQLAKLESHVQTHPEDRDAWLVLGAEWFLSGRTGKAADVFKRLDDPARKSDVALAAFLDASNQQPRQPPPRPDADRDR